MMFIVDEQPNLHPRPKGGEVHRMMISQTGEGKADKGAELVPPAERTKTHTGRPEQRISPAGSWFRPSAREKAN